MTHFLLGRGSTGASADRKSTRLNSSHLVISYAVFCLKKKHVAQQDQARSHRSGSGSHRGSHQRDACRQHTAGRQAQSSGRRTGLRPTPFFLFKTTASPNSPPPPPQPPAPFT